MENATRIALLEKENFQLKEENEVLFKTVDQMRNSINLLINRFIGNTNSNSSR